MSAALKSTAFFIWTRHRFGIIVASALYVLIAAFYDTAWASEGKPFVVQMLTFPRLAAFVLPLFLCSTTVNVATADLATGESWYPSHLLRLPLTAAQLAGTFMAYAVGLCAVLWALGIFITDGRLLLAGPLDAPPEMLLNQPWQPFLQIAMLVWIQALIWMPFRRRWLRIALLFVLVAAYFAALIFAIHNEASNAWVIAGALLQVPLAYLVAVRGIAAARVGGWDRGGRNSAAQTARAARSSAGVKPPFASAVAAQRWFESRVQRTRAGVVATFLVPFLLLISILGWLGGQGSMGKPEPAAFAFAANTLLFFTIAMIALITGPAFATFDATVQAFKKDATRMPTFFAALPLPTGEFAWMKLRAAARRMGLIAALMLGVSIALGMTFGVSERLTQSFSALIALRGEWTVYAMLGFAGVAFITFAASSTANIVWVGLLGRHFQTANTIIAVIVASFFLMPIWLRAGPERARVAAEITSWLLPLTAVLKVCGLVALIYVVGSRRLYTWTRIGWIGACWISAVAASLTVYLLYSPASSLTHVLTNLVLITPVLGIVGAPLALQGNRSR